MEENNQIKIQCRNISKSFVVNNNKIQVLQDISLEVFHNEFLVVLGPGQCGKTTLLKCIAGLYALDTGDILLDGKVSSEPGPDRGMVYQNYGLFPWKSVLDNVAFGLEIQGVGKKERHDTARRYISMVGLEGFEQKYPDQLSGGMKQRVGIARLLPTTKKIGFPPCAI